VHHRAALGKVLRACVNQNDAEAVALARRTALDGLADLAFEHGVAGSVYRVVGQLTDLDLPERTHLAAAALQNRIDHDHINRDVRHLVQIFEPLGSPWLIVKGPAVASTLYDPPELRNAGDIDVLVAPDQFARAVALLENAGHPVDDANWPLVRRLTAGQLHMMLPNDTALDLHWHLLFNSDERLQFPVTTTELVRRRRSVSIAGADLFTLDSADTLIHLSFHAAKEGGDRLGWLSDITRAAAVSDLDWDHVVSRSLDWRMELPVGTMLQRAVRELDAPVPADVLERLMPRAWRSWMTLVDRAFPVATMTRRLGNPSSLLAKSATVAPTPFGATGAALTGGVRRFLQLAQTGKAARLDPAGRSETPGGLRYQAEFSAADREAYFAAVGAAEEERGVDG
jgi:hypothetical protein